MKFKFFILLTITFVNNYEYDKLLTKNYKTDVEFIFDHKNTNIDDQNISKLFHNFKTTELNTNLGSSFNCLVPSKIKKEKPKLSNTIDIIDDSLAYLFLKEASNLCYNSNFAEWFYKLCPFKMAQQILSYKRQNEKGNEFTELWLLGSRNESQIINEDIYIKETNDSISYDIDKSESFMMVEGRVAKIYNYNLSDLKNYDAGIIIYYSIDEMKKYPDAPIDPYHKNLEYYMSNNSNVTVIPVQRRILKIINKYVLVDQEFPSPKFQIGVNINIIKIKKNNEIRHSFTLIIYDDYVYCYKCEFLTHYSVGDSLVIKNSKFSEGLRNIFNSKIYESRRIISIIDNNLLKVEKPYSKQFNIPCIRNNYFVVKGDYWWKSGHGYITVKGSTIIGHNVNFYKIQAGDQIFLFDQLVINQTHMSTTTNSRVQLDDNCTVERIISKNILITVKPCQKPFNFKGDFLIGKPFYIYPLNLYKNDQNNKLESPIDFYTIDNLLINKNVNNFYVSNYLFHPGFQIKDQANTVFRFKLEKLSQGKAVLRILLSIETHPSDNDYEILINSDNGIYIKRISSNEFNFHDTGIRTLFHETVYLDIIIYQNKAYVNIKGEEDGEILVDHEIDNINKIYFDLLKSYNVNIKGMRKINFIENKYLRSIFKYEKKLQLSPESRFIENYTYGDFCDENKSYRTARIEYKCDLTGNNDIFIENVSEPSPCVYNYSVKTKFICNPYDIMQSKINNSVEKTRCYIKNSYFNRNSNELFEN